MKITDVVTESHRVLEEASIPHAIGGAIALSYHGRPRSTMDVDINVFDPYGQVDSVVDIRGPQLYPRMARFRSMVRQAGLS